MTATNRLLADRCSGEQVRTGDGLRAGVRVPRKSKGHVFPDDASPMTAAPHVIFLWLDRHASPWSVSTTRLSMASRDISAHIGVQPKQFKSLDYVGRVRRFVDFFEKTADKFQSTLTSRISTRVSPTSQAISKPSGIVSSFDAGIAGKPSILRIG